MSRRKKWVLVLSVALLLAIVGSIPWPQPINAARAPRIVAHAVRAVVHDRRVLTPDGYRRLYDSGSVKANGRLYFRNELGISDSVFSRQGLIPIPSDRRPDVDSGDVILCFSRRDVDGEEADTIHFAYIFGSLGAQGYEIRTYRSLLFRYVVYTHRWVS